MEFSRSVQESRKWLDLRLETCKARNLTSFAITRRVDVPVENPSQLLQVVGMAQVTTLAAQEFDLSILLHSALFYKGVGCEAMKAMIDNIWISHPTLEALYARTTAENTAGYRMFKQLGFQTLAYERDPVLLPMRGVSVPIIRHCLRNPYLQCI